MKNGPECTIDVECKHKHPTGCTATYKCHYQVATKKTGMETMTNTNAKNAANKSASPKTITAERDKADGLPVGGQVHLETTYGMLSKQGSLGFGGKAVDDDGRRYQFAAWLIGSKPS